MLGANNVGKEFWFSIPPCIEDESAGYENFIKLFITATSAATVTIEVPGKGFQRTITTIPNDIVEINLPPNIAQVWQKASKDAPPKEILYSGAGIHVYSEQPIVVYAMIRYAYTSDGFLALPVSSLGMEYVSATYEEMSSMYAGLHIPSEITITGVYENTMVHFTLGGNYKTKTSGGKNSGDTISRILQPGDVMCIATDIDGGDISGSLIQSNKPVSVVSGNYCANVPKENRACDYIVEQDNPTYTWGKEYHVPKIPKRKYSSIIRVFAKEPNTSIYRNGELVGLLRNGPGGQINKAFMEMRMNALDTIVKSIVVTADKPIMVVLYNTGAAEDGALAANSDPFMMSMTPIEQYQTDITFCTPGVKGSGFKENYLNVVFQIDAFGNIPDDLEFGEVVSGAIVWEPVVTKFSATKEDFTIDINYNKYAAKTLTLPHDGVYRLRSNTPIACYSFGFSPYDSYGYPTSSALADLEKVDTLPPKISLAQHQNGDIIGASVEDLPVQPENRSNLSMILMIKDSSFNYNFSYKEFIPGSSHSTLWDLKVSDQTKDAKAVLVFCDRRGNDTMIVVEYKAPITNVDDIKQSEIIITPNPASDFIEISLSPAGGGRGWTLPTDVILSEAKNLVKIYNTLGIEFTPPQTPPLEGRGLKIDISNLSPGVYFIKIGDKFEKFVKW